jgi:hypothetical protein
MQIYSNHYFEHNLISKIDFRMIPIVVTLFYCMLFSNITSIIS